MSEGKLVILSAPSGTGKTTICRELLKRNPKWLFSISVTTREKRENETPEKDYIFITNEKFDHLIKFLHEIPPEPHTQEDHDVIHEWENRFKQLMEKENASSN